jgi:hypothetical protein
VFLVYAWITLVVFLFVIFLLVYHSYLIYYNKTTIENIKEDKESVYNRCLGRHSTYPASYSIDAYNLGGIQNIQQVSSSIVTFEY